jgi:hypothetical protein
VGGNRGGGGGRFVIKNQIFINYTILNSVEATKITVLDQ